MKTSPKVVLLGGGTGSFTLLQGLKDLTPNLTAIVSMSDDGGSTGVLRDELGVLPPGDVRKCLVALSDTPEVRDLFNYRFSDGRFEGQSVGNIILSGLELQTGSFEEAVETASKILHITGSVVPVTLDNHTLVMNDGDAVHRGEHVIDTAPRLSSQARVRLEPMARLNPKAAQAIQQADMVVLAPGSVYTSIIPILVVDGFAEALQTTSATIVSVANLVNKPGQTDDWHVADFIRKYEEYIGEGTIDIVLYNNQPIGGSLLEKYAADGEFPVRTDPEAFAGVHAQPVGSRLVSKDIVPQDPADTIRRSFIRHDAARVCAELRKLLENGSDEKPPHSSLSGAKRLFVNR